MNLKTGQTIIRANIVLGLAALISFIVAIVVPEWTVVPSAIGALAAVVLFRAHIKLARMFSSAER